MHPTVHTLQGAAPYLLITLRQHLIDTTLDTAAVVRMCVACHSPTNWHNVQQTSTDKAVEVVALHGDMHTQATQQMRA